MNSNFNPRPSIPVAENEVADSEIFAALDPKWPGLESVVKSYRSGRLEAAKRELMAYFYRRKTPRWFFDWRERPASPDDLRENRFIWGDSAGVSDREFARKMIAEADQLCRGLFLGAVVHDFGPKWDSFPVFDKNADKDDKPLRVTANRFVRMNFLIPLAIAYHLTRERRYAETFVRLMGSFAENHLRQYPYVPDPVESDEAYSIQFSKTPFRSMMSVGQSAVNLVKLMYTELFYADLVPVGLQFRLFRYVWYVMRHHLSFARNRFRPHNHHLFERGVMPLMFGVMFPEFPQLFPLQEQGRKVIFQHMERDFHPSGGYDEHSMGYTCTTLSEFLVPLKVLADNNHVKGFDGGWEESMRKTYAFYSGLVLPDGTFPDTGDNGRGNARQLLEEGRHLYKSAEADAVMRALELESAAGSGKAQRMKRKSDSGCEWRRDLPPLTVQDPLAGYLCARSDWTPTSHCMVLCNKEYTESCSHNHLDMLSLTLAVHGETLIGEPQAAILYKYISDRTELDTYMRGLGSHNSVLVGGVPVTKEGLRRQDQWAAQSVRTEEVAEWGGGVYIRASHEAYPHARHTREVLFDHRRGWKVVDTIDRLAGNDSAAPHVQRWHLEHGVTAAFVGSHALVLIGRKARLLCVWPRDSQVAFRLWRNEQSLGLEGLARYRDIEDLPWVVDVVCPRNSGRSDGGSEQIRCIFADVTEVGGDLEAMVEKCADRLEVDREMKGASLL